MLGIELGDRLEQTCLQHTMQNNRGKWELEAENEFGKLRKFHYWKLALIHDALSPCFNLCLPPPPPPPAVPIFCALLSRY